MSAGLPTRSPLAPGRRSDVPTLYIVVTEADHDNAVVAIRALTNAGITIHRSWLIDPAPEIPLQADLDKTNTRNFNEVLDILQPRG